MKNIFIENKWFSVISSTQKAIQIETPIGLKWIPLSVLEDKVGDYVSFDGERMQPVKRLKGWFFDKNPEFYNIW